MDNYLKFTGNANQIIKEMQKAFAADEINVEKEEMKQVLDFILDHREIMTDGDLLQTLYSVDETSASSEFMTADGNYYIGLKNTTLFLIIHILKKISPSLCISISLEVLAEVLDVDPIFFRWLNQIEGETCILLEAKKAGRSGCNKNPLKSFRGECCNNWLDCKFREDGQCVIKPETAERIMEEFEKKGFVKKRGFNKYVYQL